MGFIWTIIVGFIIGVLAKFLHPGRDNMGFILTTLFGIAGSLAATFVGQALHLYEPGEPAGFIGAIVGAVILLAIYGRVRQSPA